MGRDVGLNKNNNIIHEILKKPLEMAITAMRNDNQFNDMLPQGPLPTGIPNN